jgi:hypothetical protein
MNTKAPHDTRQNEIPLFDGGLVIIELEPWDKGLTSILFLLLFLLTVAYDLFLCWLSAKGLVHGHTFPLLWLGFVIVPRCEMVTFFFSLRLIWIGTVCKKAAKRYLTGSGHSRPQSEEQNECLTEGN